MHLSSFTVVIATRYTHFAGVCVVAKALAEDMLQDAFVRAWNKLHLFRGDSKFGTWLHRLTVNVVLSDKRIRVKRLQREQALGESVARTMAGERDVSAGLRKDLEAAIAGLPERLWALQKHSYTGPGNWFAKP